MELVSGLELMDDFGDAYADALKRLKNLDEKKIKKLAIRVKEPFRSLKTNQELKEQVHDLLVSNGFTKYNFILFLRDLTFIPRQGDSFVMPYTRKLETLLGFDDIQFVFCTIKKVSFGRIIFDARKTKCDWSHILFGSDSNELQVLEESKRISQYSVDDSIIKTDVALNFSKENAMLVNWSFQRSVDINKNIFHVDSRI